MIQQNCIIFLVIAYSGKLNFAEVRWNSNLEQMLDVLPTV